MDKLLKEFFNNERWETALNDAYFKGINKGQLRALTSPETRARLYRAIADGNYIIAPPHMQLIPKDNGEYRTVYINENIDRIFLSIVNNMLFDFCKPMIHHSCKSYQKGIGCGKVVQKVSKEICKFDSEIVGFKSDLSKYFDTVPIEFIDKVFDEIESDFTGTSAILNILREYYHTDLCFDTDGNVIELYQSLKQGCSTASFFADAVLYHIDEKLSNLNGYYVRYSDDILFVGEDYELAMQILKDELAKMNMKLNPKKVEQIYHDKWVKFLGFKIKDDKITLSKSRLKSFQKEVEKRSIKKKGVTKQKALNSINAYLYKGDGNYSWATSVLPIINVDKDIDTLNDFVMDCIRACETGKKKIGGLGSVDDCKDYTILRGVGKNVKANKIKTSKDIEGYYTIKCMQNNILTCKQLYETIVRQM